MPSHSAQINSSYIIVFLVIHACTPALAFSFRWYCFKRFLLAQRVSLAVHERKHDLQGDRYRQKLPVPVQQRAGGPSHSHYCLPSAHILRLMTRYCVSFCRSSLGSIVDVRMKTMLPVDSRAFVPSTALSESCHFLLGAFCQVRSFR